MTINAPAALLLLLYELAAEEQGVPGDKLRGTVQNDILKEYIARGNYIFPPRPSMRITTDLFAYCAERLPRFNTISISGYHIREAGSTAVQELAFTIANGIAYCEAAVAAGLSPDEFGERVSFFFNAHNDFLQEVAKFRAARRLWARVMRERFGATNPRALALRFHAQTGGSTLTAQQPELNIVRVAIQALAAVAAAPSRCTRTRSTRRSRCRPSGRRGSRCARSRCSRTRRGRRRPADPLGGSYAVEALTRELESAGAGADRAHRRARRRRRGRRAGVRAAARSRRRRSASHRDVERGERVVVGVNRYVDDGEAGGRAPAHRSRDRAPAARAHRARPRRARRRRPRAARSRRCEAPRKARVTCSCPCAKRSVPAARSARSAASCEASSAPTTKQRPAA